MLPRGLNIWPFLMLMLAVSSTASPQSQAESSTTQITELEKRAEQGDPDAELALAKAYDDGNGIAQNDALAVKWYRAAAEQGNAKAQNDLGVMYRSGRGVERSKEEAVKWYKKAAKQKNASAMFNLGTAYYNGDGVAIDDTTAFAWFLLAQESGSSSAVDAVDRMRTGSKSPEADALEEVGDMYQKGDELPRSRNDAMIWYRKAGENGSGSAKVKLASLLIQSQGGVERYEEAHRLCEEAAKLQYSRGVYCLGVIYEQGLGVAQDLAQSAKLFTEAANMGSGEAMLRLGEMYWSGSGVNRDKVSAYEFVLLSSSLGVPQAVEKRELFQKEMEPKEVKKAKAKANEWIMNHHLLVLKRMPTAAHSQ